jgi:hypothetical protein
MSYLLPPNTPEAAITAHTTGSAQAAAPINRNSFDFGNNRFGGLEGWGRMFQGLGSLGQIYAAIQGVKLGKQQLNFARQAFNTNTGNQTQTYNTSLEDRIRARYNTEGRSGEADGYLDQHRLTHRPL